MLSITIKKYKLLQSHFPLLRKFLLGARAVAVYLALPAVLTVGLAVAVVIPGVIAEIRHYRIHSFEKFSDISASEFLRSAGWIPLWLPPSSTDIFLAYSVNEDIPSFGEEWIVFHFPPSDLFYKYCQPLDRKHVSMPYVRTPLSGMYRDVAKRFLPDFIKNLIATVKQGDDIRFYRCHRNADKILAVDHQNFKGYIWHYRSLPRMDFDVSEYSFGFDIRLTQYEDNQTELLQLIPERAQAIEIHSHKYSDELWALFRYTLEKQGDYLKNCQEIPAIKANVPPLSRRYWRPYKAMQIIGEGEGGRYGRSAFYHCGLEKDIYLVVVDSDWHRFAVLWKKLYADEPLP